VAPFGPGTERTAEELLVEADLAMYRAKGHGPGNVEVFDEQMRGQLAARMEIRRASRGPGAGTPGAPLPADHSLRTACLSGCEALVRWAASRARPDAPAHFIPVAEDSGLIVEVGAWVLEEACRQAEAWRQRWTHLHARSTSRRCSCSGTTSPPW